MDKKKYKKNKKKKKSKKKKQRHAQEVEWTLEYNWTRKVVRNPL